MGADIHGWVEKRINGKWVAYKDIGEHPQAGRRNYKRFAALAGVRGEGPGPLGLPHDISDTAKLHADELGEDGHSHSFLSLKDAVKIFRETHLPSTIAHEFAEGMNNYIHDYPFEFFFDVDDDYLEEENIDNYRIVFWFDN